MRALPDKPMPLRTSRSALAVSLALTCGSMLAVQPVHATLRSAGAAKARQAHALSFGPTTGCERLPGYDPLWASHDDDFGFLQVGTKPPPGQAEKGEEDDPIFLSGFYQMQTHGNTLYAAFGGASTRGVTPGALVVLNARTLAFQKIIPLPFASHAMALDCEGRRAVVTHTRVNAFSLVDLATGQSTCRKPDTAIRGDAYQGRYVQMDEHGFFYINYNSFSARVPKGYVMKYTPRGDHAAGFAVRATERADLVIPLLYRQGALLTGTHAVRAVNSQTGAVSRLSPVFGRTNFYNYAVTTVRRRDPIWRRSIWPPGHATISSPAAVPSRWLTVRRVDRCSAPTTTATR